MVKVRKNKTNRTLRVESYKVNFSFTTQDFVPFGTDCQYMFYMSKVLLKDMIDGVRVPQFQLDYICDKIIFYIRIWLSCVVKWIICGGGTNSCNLKIGKIA